MTRTIHSSPPSDRRLFVVVATCALAACADASDGSGARSTPGAPALQLGALDAGPRTIPYGGYVDFDGEPVNASGVKFNFALFACATPATCGPALWVARGTWSGASTWPAGWPTSEADTVSLPIFSGRFTVELGGPGQNPLPDVLFEDAHASVYLAIRIQGSTLTTLQKLTPAFRAISGAESGRFRVRDAIEIDDPAGGSATLSADHGLVIDHSDPGATRLLQVGSDASPSLIVTKTGVTALGVTFGDNITKLKGTLEDAGMARAEGGMASGSNVEFAGIDLDLGGRTGRWMHVYGGTAISENFNHSNTSIVRLRLTRPGGDSIIVAAQRQGMGVYGDPGGNQTVSISAQGYWRIPESFAVAGVRLSLVGGVDAPESFWWGKQANYIHFDGELAGATVGYAIF